MKTRAWVLSAVIAVGVMASAAGSAEAGEGKIVVKGFEADERTLALQLNASNMSVSDDGLDAEGSAHLGGFNLAVRWDTLRWGGIELAVGGYSRLDETGLVDESRGMTSLSWLWYFARHHRHRFYGLIGVAGLSTELRIGNSSYNYSEGGGLIGLGSEWLFRDRWMVTVDARLLSLNSSRHEKEGRLQANEPEPPGDLDRTPFPAEWYTPPEERVAVMFNMGIGYRW